MLSTCTVHFNMEQCACKWKKKQITNHNQHAKNCAFFCKVRWFCTLNCLYGGFPICTTTAHAFYLIKLSYYLLRMLFLNFSNRHLVLTRAGCRRSWWDQSRKVCLKCCCDTIDRNRCMNRLTSNECPCEVGPWYFSHVTKMTNVFSAELCIVHVCTQL